MYGHDASKYKHSEMAKNTDLLCLPFSIYFLSFSPLLLLYKVIQTKRQKVYKKKTGQYL